MRIAILTGGGDVPGLNSCIKAITLNAAHQGWEVLGFKRGWAGPLAYDPANGHQDLVPLTPDTVRVIDRTGGTILHSSRTNPAKVKAKVVDLALTIERKTARGTVFRIHLPAGVTLVSGKERVEGPHLDGHAPKTSLQAFLPSREVTGDRAVVEWIVHGPRGSAVGLSATADRAGSVHTEVTLD